jgi:lysophospholipid hydrolase
MQLRNRIQFGYGTAAPAPETCEKGVEYIDRHFQPVQGDQGVISGEFSMASNSNGNGTNGHGGGKQLTPPDQIERRASRLLRLIEARSGYVRDEARRALEAYFLSDHRRFGRSYNLNYFQDIRLSRGQPGISDLAHSVDQWQRLIPSEPALQAGLLHLLNEKYPLGSEAGERVIEAVGGSAQAVLEAYASAFGRPFVVTVSDPESDPPRAEAAASDLPEEEAAIQAAIASLEWVSLQGGDRLFSAGDESDALYILVSGRIYRALDDDAGVCALNENEEEFGRGELVGEVGVLTGQPREATLVAARDSELVRLPARELDRLAAAHPVVMRRLNQLLAQRFSAQNTEKDFSDSSVITFALLPGSENPQAARRLSEFAQAFVAGLSVYGAALHLSAAQVDAELEPGTAQTPSAGLANSRLTSWLNEHEARFRYVVYEADSRLSEWTMRCIRQADRILVAAPAGENSALNEIERYLQESGNVCSDLVLLHPASTRQPSGTRQWLEARQSNHHYHIRLDRPADIQRLVRLQTGRALRLVLGGGGARGFAHVGVLQALRETGFYPDAVGGSSMGAILGAAFALGHDDRSLSRLAKKFASPFKLFDPTLPLVSFFSTQKICAVLEQVFGDIQIEDLWLPFFCMSSSLTRAAPVVHQRGTLWLALRASAAIPGIFAPVLFEGDLLVDGAVLNNLPVDVMHEWGHGGPVVTVNVIPEVDLKKTYHFGNSVSGWKVLRNKLNPFEHSLEVPNIFENLVRVVSLNDAYIAREKRRMSDLFITPPVEQYGILDFRAYRPIIQGGYQAGLEALEDWKNSPTAGYMKESRAPRPTDLLARALDDLEEALGSL